MENKIHSFIVYSEIIKRQTENYKKLKKKKKKFKKFS